MMSSGSFYPSSQEAQDPESPWCLLDWGQAQLLTHASPQYLCQALWSGLSPCLQFSIRGPSLSSVYTLSHFHSIYPGYLGFYKTKTFAIFQCTSYISPLFVQQVLAPHSETG